MLKLLFVILAFDQIIMPESTFRFKQFEIKQDKTAMKVGTDGVLIGAWANVKDAKTILDIGCGTGLIALMAAQRSPEARISAIEIDEAAYLQAKENIESSKWKNRVSLIHSSLQEFSKSQMGKFDLIISNPPYFSNAFKPEGTARAKARHTDTLSFDEFFFHSAALLEDRGSICIIIPAANSLDIKNEASRQMLSLKRLCRVYPNPDKPEKRQMMEFVKQEIKTQETIEEELVVESNGRHQYSNEYKQLTKDFYLKF